MLHQLILRQFNEMFGTFANNWHSYPFLFSETAINLFVSASGFLTIHRSIANVRRNLYYDVHFDIIHNTDQ